MYDFAPKFKNSRGPLFLGGWTTFLSILTAVLYYHKPLVEIYNIDYIKFDGCIDA